MSSNNSNQLVNPQAREAMDRFLLHGAVLSLNRLVR